MQFTDPGAERAIIGCITAGTFSDIPQDALIPPEAFHDPVYRVVYCAATEITAKGQPAYIASVNNWLQSSGGWREISKALHPSSWECWSNSPDESCAFMPPGILEDCFERIHQCYITREEARICSEVTQGIRTLSDVTDDIARLLDARRGNSGPKSALLLDYFGKLPDPADTLLGHRYLCRGGGMLFVGPSGMGKSSASVQQDIQWSLGRPSFGIAPARPLKILTIQAEDDAGDIGEMVSGVCKFLDLTPQEIAEARERCVYVPHKSSTGQAFIAFVRSQLRKHRPDLLRINPLQAYLGGDIKNPEKTAEFLRTGINPLLEEFNCGVIIVHHTPKTNFRDTEEWKTSDWMYAGAGSADITNWARAILIADPTENPHVFEWIAAKRGRRIGWAQDNGEFTIKRHFSHSSNGGIHWDDTHESEIPVPKKKGGSKKQYAETHILDQMHLVDARKVTEIRRRVMDNTGMSKATFFALWEALQKSEKLIETPEGWRKII